MSEEDKFMCSDGVWRTKQELFERMPVMRWDDWNCYLRDGELVWEHDEPSVP